MIELRLQLLELVPLDDPLCFASMLVMLVTLLVESLLLLWSAYQASPDVDGLSKSTRHRSASMHHKLQDVCSPSPEPRLDSDVMLKVQAHHT